MAAPSKAEANRADIDGLRAVAILSVLGFHAYPSVVTGGFVGVDIFFVISGFLITQLIVREIGAELFSLASFWARRVRRLLPAAAIVYLSATLASGFILLPDAFREFGASLGGASLVYANHVFYKLSGYFAAAAHEKPLLHTWSLSVEEQFYLIWPLLLLLVVPRVSRRTLLLLAAAALLASLIHSQLMLVRDQQFAFYMLQTRAWELLIGAVLAIAAPRLAFGRSIAEILAVIGLLLIGASLWALDASSPFPGLAALPACLGAACILGAGLRHATVGGNLLSTRPMVAVGLISYSLYLWHWPLLSLAHYHLERAPEGMLLVALLAAAFVLATLSWWLIEQPFRHPGGWLWLPVRPALIAGAATIAVFAVGGRILVQTDGLPGRLDEAARTVFRQKVSQNPKRRDCEGIENAFRNDAFCNIGRSKAEGVSFDAVIIGDSQADQFVPAFAPLLERAGLSARQLTQNGCGPVIGLAKQIETTEAKYRACPAFHETIVRWVEANPGLKLAIIATYWPHYEYKGLRINAARRPPGLPWPETLTNASDTFERSLRAMLTFFEQRGIRVLVVGALPELESDLPLRCAVEARRAGISGRTCEWPAQNVVAVLDRSNALLRRIADHDPLLSVLVPSEMLCMKQRCATVLDGTFLYFDHNHVNAEGSAVLGRRFTLPRLGPGGQGG